MSSKTETLYDKLNSLSNEIRGAIFDLSEDRSKLMENELQSLHDQAFKERSPEAVYNTLLFRKYAQLASKIKESKGEKYSLADIPTLYDIDDNKLVGWEAVSTNIFLSRLATCILAFISFVVMATAPNISHSVYDPTKDFYSSCPYQFQSSGTFNFHAFQAAIAVGVIIFSYNFLFCIYYCLPINADRHKYVPGLSWLFGRTCLDSQRAGEVDTCFGQFCLSFSKFIETLLDGLLLIMTIIIAIVASIVLERSQPFDFNGTGKWYFTIGAFYMTFSNTNPVCIQDTQDPAPKIRASLGMLYLALIPLTACLLASTRAFRQQLAQESNAVIATSPTKNNNSNSGDNINSTSNSTLNRLQSIPLHTDDYNDETTV